MSTLKSRPRTLRAVLLRHEHSGAAVIDKDRGIRWHDLPGSASAGARDYNLRGRPVIIATRTQMGTIAALVQLDGVVRRVVLYPGDLAIEHLPHVARSAGAEAIVTDRLPATQVPSDLVCFGVGEPLPGDPLPSAESTEWVLLTSGTTGKPKLVAHSLAGLAGAIDAGTDPSGIVWSTFYDIRRYGGLQIFLRAAFAGTPLVLSSAEESTDDFLVRCGQHKVSHISATPSHWRRALMSPLVHAMTPRYVRLSGEIADQALLQHLQRTYPQAQVAHAFATTEAGVVLVVNDGLAGFPAQALLSTPHVEIKISDGSLWVRSDRTAHRYLGDNVPLLRDADDFVDTGDVVESRGGRYFFAGRRDGMINVGGQKVYPEEVEAVINEHPRVHMSLVRTRKNPITGALVVADVVLDNSPEAQGADARELHDEILLRCRQLLSPHKVPAAIRFVPSLDLASSGKLVRGQG